MGGVILRPDGKVGFGGAEEGPGQVQFAPGALHVRKGVGGIEGALVCGGSRELDQRTSARALERPAAPHTDRAAVSGELHVCSLEQRAGQGQAAAAALHAHQCPVHGDGAGVEFEERGSAVAGQLGAAHDLEEVRSVDGIDGTNRVGSFVDDKKLHSVLGHRQRARARPNSDGGDHCIVDSVDDRDGAGAFVGDVGPLAIAVYGDVVRRRAYG